MRLARRLSPRQPTACLHFHFAPGFATPRLARLLHSLVRVSRRVGCSHPIANDCSATRHRPPVRAFVRRRALHADPDAATERPGAARDLPPRGRPALTALPRSSADSHALGSKYRSGERAPARERSSAAADRRWPARTRVQRSRQLSGEQSLSALADRHRCATSLLNSSEADSAAFASLLTVSRSF